MDYQSQLAQYRAMFAQKKEQEKKEQEGVEYSAPEAIWADEIEMPVAGMQVDPSVMMGEVEMPQLMYDTDTRLTGNAEEDEAAFRDFAMNDPMFKEYGPQMEAMLQEVIAQASDPENPMTPEEAQQIFLEMMEEQFGQYFK